MKNGVKALKAMGIFAMLFVLYILCFGTADKSGTALVFGFSVAVGVICAWMPRQLPMSEETQEKILRLVNTGIIFLCGAIMLVLCLRKNYTYDEAYTMGIMNRDYMEIVEITANDVHSPLYYFVLKFFCGSLGGIQLYATKIFSLIFFILHLIFGGKFCRKIYGRKVEFYWLILSAFMPAMVIQATSVRMYAMGLCLFTISAYLAYSLYQKESVGKWIAFAAVSILTMYVHTFSMLETFVLYLILLGVLIWKKRYKSLIPFGISGAVASLCYIPWLVVLWHQMRRWAGYEEGWQNTIEALTFSTVDKFFAEWFSTLENPQPMAILFGVSLFVYVAYYVRKHAAETKDYLPYAGMAIAGIVVAAAIIVSVRIVPCFLGRYIFPVFGLLWLFVAVGLEKVQAYWKKAVIVATIFLCGVFAYREEWRLENETGLNQYIEYMSENLGENDVIMTNTFTEAMMSIYFPEERYMAYGHVPVCFPFGNYEVFTEWEQLEDVETIWFLELNEGRASQLSEYYDCEKVLNFSFSYYNFTLQKLTRR